MPDVGLSKLLSESSALRAASACPLAFPACNACMHVEKNMDRVSPTLLFGGRFNLHSPEAVPHRFTSMERWKRETKKQNELGSVKRKRNVMRRTKVLILPGDGAAAVPFPSKKEPPQPTHTQPARQILFQ